MRNQFKEELRIFLTAVMFYTRIPCPSYAFKEQYIHQASRYFPLIGWIVGSVTFLVFIIAHRYFDLGISVSLSLLSGVLLTGAFHEDGLADAVDGFGGGWDRTKILDIMKDSRVGAYGAIALILLFLMKYAGFSALAQVFNAQNLHQFIQLSTSDFILLGLIFINIHTLARFTAIMIVFTSTYAREDETSKVKPIAKQHSKTEVIGATIWTAIPLIALSGFDLRFLWIMLPLIILVVWARRYFNRWLGGYTGDCLGAVEQIAEVICLLGFGVVLNLYHLSIVSLI